MKWRNENNGGVISVMAAAAGNMALKISIIMKAISKMAYQ
jgi:hypothetical protein